MLVKNTNTEKCRHSWLEDGSGECCCNCANRYLLVRNNIPIKYFCNIKEMDLIMPLDGSGGHGMCEMHTWVRKTKEI